MSETKNALLTKLKDENINNNIIDVIDKIDPSLFFDTIFKTQFYTDEVIAIGKGEISDQITALARMINYLAPDKNSRILEVGTGSGFSTAILSELSGEVVTVEYHEELALNAKGRITGQKNDNVKFYAGNVFEFDVPDKFDGILLLAAFHERPLYLTRFLKEKGKIVFPMGPESGQQISVIKKSGSEHESMENIEISFHEFCIFTPLIEMYE